MKEIYEQLEHIKNEAEKKGHVLILSAFMREDMYSWTEKHFVMSTKCDVDDFQKAHFSQAQHLVNFFNN